MRTKAAPPWTVRTFETLSIVLVGTDLVLQEGFSLDDLVWIPLYFWLILSITRKKSEIARVIFTAISAVGATIIAAALWNAPASELAEISAAEWSLAVTMSLVAAFQVWLVWSRSSTEWLSARTVPTSDINVS